MSLRHWIFASIFVHWALVTALQDHAVILPTTVVAPGVASTESMKITMVAASPDPVLKQIDEVSEAQPEKVVPIPQPKKSTAKKKAVPNPPKEVKQTVAKEKAPEVRKGEIEPPQKEIVPVEKAPPAEKSEGARWIRPADYKRNAPPKYPVRSRSRGEEGVVVLRVNISASGEADAVQIHQSSGFFRLDKAARESIRKWEFRPAEQNGRRIAMQVLIPVKFELRS